MLSDDALIEPRPKSTLAIMIARIVTDLNGRVFRCNVGSRRQKLFGHRREDLTVPPTRIPAPGPYCAGLPAHRMDNPAESCVRAMGEGRELYGLHRTVFRTKGSPAVTSRPGSTGYHCRPAKKDQSLLSSSA
jgi:hypothetical protein